MPSIDKPVNLRLVLLGAVLLLLPYEQALTLWRADVPYGDGLHPAFVGIQWHMMDTALVGLVILSLGLYKEVLGRVGLWVAWWMPLILWMSISFIWAKEPILAAYHATHFGLEVLLALSLVGGILRGYGTTILWLFTGAGVVHSLVGIAQLLNGGSLGLVFLGELQRPPDNPFGFGPQAFRAVGFAFHPNSLAGYLMVTWFAALHLWRYALLVGGWPRWVALLAWLIIGVGLLATISRSALLASAIAGASLVMFTAITGLKPAQRWGLLGGLIMMGWVILAGLSTLEHPLMNRFTLLIENPRAFESRFLYAFEDTSTTIAAHPLMGVGQHNLMVTIAENPTHYPILPAHNGYWVTWSELGFVGVVSLFIAILGTLRQPPQSRFEAAFIWRCVLLAIALVMLADYYFWFNLPSRTMLLACVGMIWGSSYRYPSEESRH